MARDDAAIWLQARKLFKEDKDDRHWSNGLLARELQRIGARLVTEAEKDAYYDRAAELLEKQGLNRFERA